MSKGGRLGLVQVYTGNGKGKTTAALGLALRAAGWGYRTYIGQFMKGQPCGEVEALKHLRPHITIERFGDDQFVHPDHASSRDVAQARDGLERIWAAMASGRYDIVVAEEINVALAFGLVTLDEVLALIDGKLPEVELVLTGRHAHPEVVARADLVTEIADVKHPYRQGVAARRGIEF